MNFYLKITLKLIGGSIVSLWSYYTLSIYLKRRKYRHIPGPIPKGLIKILI